MAPLSSETNGGPLANGNSARAAVNAPVGQDANWIQTMPGKGWFTILRVYGPLKPWFDQTWRPGEIEAV